jgi:transcriptional regulator with PAS, ATPase and Fis domain
MTRESDREGDTAAGVRVSTFAKTSDQQPPVIVGSSPALRGLLQTAATVARRSAKVLVTGESGVGKDVIARFIHFQSTRATQRFIAINCGSISEPLLESELFGHVRGSFTGAHRDKIGKLQQAHRGTIFLDEIAEMSVRMQALLLRFLENGELQPVGSDAPPVLVDVRVISATHRDLPSMVSKGEFRQDLLYRIDGTHLHVPALRERREDIRELVTHILGRSQVRMTFAEDALEALERYGWPGNVRELQNVIEQAMSVASSDQITAADLPPRVLTSSSQGAYTGAERRRNTADDLYDGLLTGGYRFWEDVHSLFTSRDLSRGDLRQLIRRGLTTTGGNYRALLPLFGLDQQDYKRFMNFLAAHDCVVDYREFRQMDRNTSVK